MESNLVLIFTFGIVTFILWMLTIPYYINFLIQFKLGQQIREDGLLGKAPLFSALHKEKWGTPSMWGAMIIGITFFMVIFSMVIQATWIINNSLLDQKETYLPLFTLFSVGALGMVDDLMNIKNIWNNKWLTAKFKMLWLIVFAFLWALWFYFKLDWGTKNLDFWIIQDIQLGIWIIPLFIFVIIASANSVNLTDGLDGLAGGLLLFAYAVYTYITFDQGMYLLSTLCMTICWAIIAFLWFNVKPAKFYMGDVWSLALGANLWLIAMLTNTIFVFFIVAAIFIFETLSVIIQLTSKKFRNGKKVFKIAPFHHHLEAIGWSEENVVFRLWLIGLITSVFGVIFYILQK